MKTNVAANTYIVFIMWQALFSFSVIIHLTLITQLTDMENKKEQCKVTCLGWHS